MTKNKIIWMLIYIVTIIIAFIFGSRVSYNITLKKIDSMYQIAYKDNVVTDAKNKLQVIYLLRTNEYAKAIEILERLVDADLYSMANYELTQKVSDKEIENLVRDVKSYRIKYTDHKLNAGFEKTINDLLNKYNYYHGK